MVKQKASWKGSSVGNCLNSTRKNDVSWFSIASSALSVGHEFTNSFAAWIARRIYLLKDGYKRFWEELKDDSKAHLLFGVNAYKPMLGDTKELHQVSFGAVQGF
jgi:hypothetical protein